MNKSQLQRNVGKVTRLRPAARDQHDRDIDDDWLVEKVADPVVTLKHSPTGALAILGLDHIKERLSDPVREAADPNCFGFLVLNVEVIQTPSGAFKVEPIVPRLGRAAPPAARQTVTPSDERFSRIERDMPALVAEMRADLQRHPLARRFTCVSKHWVVNTDALRYHFEDHPHLADMVRILQSLGLVNDVTRGTNVPYYLILEPLADYLRTT